MSASCPFRPFIGLIFKDRFVCKSTQVKVRIELRVHTLAKKETAIKGRCKMLGKLVAVAALCFGAALANATPRAPRTLLITHC